MKKPVICCVAVFYLAIVFFSTFWLAVGQFRSASGPAYDTWRWLYNLNCSFYKTNQEKLSELKRQLSSNVISQLFATNCLKMFDTSDKLKTSIDIETLDESKAARKDHKKYNDLPVSSSKCVFRGVYMLQFEKDYFTKRVDDLNKEIADVNKLLDSNKNEYEQLINGHRDFLAFHEMEDWWYTKYFVIIPYDLLVMFLVMAMGSLGGITRILRDYVSIHQDDPPLKEYFLIPLAGSVVAICGYILAKTGLLMLSTNKGEISLNPFMIGLVGVISGLLAKEVIDSVAAAGKKIFKGNNKDQKGAAKGKKAAQKGTAVK